MQAYLSTHGPHFSIPNIKQGTKNVNLLRHCFNLVLECAENRKHSMHYKYPGVAEAYTTQPNSKASSRVLYMYFSCMAG